VHPRLPRREGTERKGHVLFVDASQRFEKGRNQNTMSDDDVEDTVAAFHTGADPDGENHGINVRLVPLEEIADNDYDLNIGRYVRAESAEEVDLETALATYQEARAARIEAEEALFERLAAAGIADLGVCCERVARGRSQEGPVSRSSQGSHVRSRYRPLGRRPLVCRGRLPRRGRRSRREGEDLERRARR
jgi:hypothetical protein